MQQRFHGFRQDLVQVVRGFAMGGADIIPGVSGGTMALLLGVYERLVTALARFDLSWLSLLRTQQWSAAARHVDLRFLVALGSGILIGVAGLARMMHHLMEHYPIATWSLLFGLILATAVLVGMMVQRWSSASLVALVASLLCSSWLVGQLPAVPPSGMWYVFLSGMVAICAMILPGISGAFILVIMGMYFHVTGALKDVSRGHITGENLVLICVFVTGCAVGLLGFSKLLRRLLTRFESETMAAMCGILFGSLRKIWPFKAELSLDQVVELGFPAERLEDLQKYRLGEDYLPRALDGQVLSAIALCAAGFAAVFLLDYLTRGHRHVPPLESREHVTPSGTPD